MINDDNEEFFREAPKDGLKLRKVRRWTKLHDLIEQANDGDYNSFEDLFPELAAQDQNASH